MIRFILKNRYRDGVNGMTGNSLFTIDVEVPELESALTAGGYSEDGYNVNDLLGAEVVQHQPQSAPDNGGEEVNEP